MQPDQRATVLAEELYRVLFEVFLVLGRGNPGGVLPGDLTLAQLLILMTLQERGPMRMTALAAHQRVRTPTTTVAIRRLEKLGLVARSRDPADLRAVVVRITPHGHAICCDALANRRVQFAAMLKALSPEDCANLNEAMSPLNRLASLAVGMAGMARNRGGLVQKRFFNATAAALIAAGIGACSSSPPAASPPGALPAGTARVTINNRALPATTAVKCAPIGSLTTITTGDTAAGVTALVSNETGLTAKSVSITDLGGFTGSYMKGLDGKTDVSMTGTTYLIRGTADGFDTDNPSVRTTGTFAIQVAC